MKNSTHRDAQLARLMRLSEKKYGLSIEADWRHRSFFDFLQISPSYHLAHMLATSMVDNPVLPADFHEVVKTYDAFGDVWQTDFWHWWIRRAQHQFGLKFPPRTHMLASMKPGEDCDQATLEIARQDLEQYLCADRLAEGKPGSVVLAIPLHLNRASILKEVSKLLDLADRDSNANEASGQFKFIKNKVRQKTLDDARRVTWARAALPRKPLYVIGNRVGISRAYITDEGRKAAKDNRRDLMVIVTSRHLQRALFFSENAARGKFPNPERVDGVQFDFLQLQRTIISHRKWVKSELDRLKILQSKADGSGLSVAASDAPTG